LKKIISEYDISIAPGL